MADKHRIELRLAKPADSVGIVALVDQVLREYGETICLEAGGAEADLQTIQASYFDRKCFGRGGAFWVLADTAPSDGNSPSHSPSDLLQPNQASRIVGTHAAVPSNQDPNVCIFRRLYLAAEYRGTDCGHRLMQVTVDWAIDQKFERVEFWSDTRFERAHRFFEKFEFKKTGSKRTMTDSHQPYQEYHFRRLL